MINEFSIVIPVYNERENIIPLVDELLNTFDNGFNIELVLVDDGSTDGTTEQIKNIETSILKPVFLNENCGQGYALHQGISNAMNQLIVTMDGDLQIDPRDISEMLRLLKDDIRLVCGRRRKRQDKFLYKITSKVGNYFIRILLNHTVQDIGCSLRIGYKEDFMSVKYFKNYHRYFTVLVANKLNKNQVLNFDIHHRKRLHGQSKYSVMKTFEVIKELVELKRNKKKLFVK